MPTTVHHVQPETLDDLEDSASGDETGESGDETGESGPEEGGDDSSDGSADLEMESDLEMEVNEIMNNVFGEI